jgi:hypothetical protein
MFRAQSNMFDDVVVKATDENLTSENWEYILVRFFWMHSAVGVAGQRARVSLQSARPQPSAVGFQYTDILLQLPC